jgi:hypothetical protein
LFSCVLTLRKDISSTSCDNSISYRYDMQMYCTFVLFVNQHFPGLPASETHCIFSTDGRKRLSFYVHISCETYMYSMSLYNVYILRNSLPVAPLKGHFTAFSIVRLTIQQ